MEAGEQFVQSIRGDVDSTGNPLVLEGIGSFGAMIAIHELNYRRPVVVAGTDGVGTKLMVRLRKHVCSFLDKSFIFLLKTQETFPIHNRSFLCYEFCNFLVF